MQRGWPLGFNWEVGEVVRVTAGTHEPHSCCWSRTGDKGAEPGPLKHLPAVVLLSAVQSGAEQGRVLHPLRRDKLPWLNA